MNTKSLLFSLSLLFCCVASQAQTFTLLANDAEGDETSIDAKDLKALSYRVNQSADSIWFKIDTYTPMYVNNDMGEFLIGIDTDMVTTDGTTWPGSNTTMKYDQLIQIDYDGYNDTILYIIRDFSTVIPATVQRQNPLSWILGFKMSDIDNDGNFNIMLGSSIPGYYTSVDDIPDTAYGKVRTAPTGITQIKNTRTFSVYPNPATTQVHWNVSQQMLQWPTEGHITDMTGRVLQKCYSNTGSVDVHTLAPGNYIIQMGANSAIFNKN